MANMKEGWLPHPRHPQAEPPSAVASQANYALDGDRIVPQSLLEPERERPGLVIEDVPHTILDEAARLTSSDREEVYGHAFDDYTRTAGIWSAILGIEVTPEQAIACMIGVKLSRLQHTPSHIDSLVDIAGYARCYEKVLERRATTKAAAHAPAPASLSGRGRSASSGGQKGS